MSEKKDQKLNLPKTSIPMKANLNLREPEMLSEWDKRNVYKKIRKNRKGKEKFILHDGPPYANGNIHLGHAVNKVLKDIVIRSKTFLYLYTLELKKNYLTKNTLRMKIYIQEIT